MRCAIFDLETSSLYANTGIILCGVVKEYDSKFAKKPVIFRGDDYPSWKNNRSNDKQIAEDILAELSKYDIVAAHNGQWFDKPWLNSVAMKYNLKYDLRGVKFIDPVLIARRHLRVARNSLASLIDYFDIPDHKTHIRFEEWIRASHDGNKAALDFIVDHCVKDVISFEKVYDKTRRLVKRIDDGGSSW